MKDLKKKYLKILLVELDDLKDDINLEIKESKEKHDNGEITNYVFLEDSAFFNNKKRGVAFIEKTLNDAMIANYGTLDEMIEDLKKFLHEKIISAGFANAVNICLDRKLDKVKKYLDTEDSC